MDLKATNNQAMHDPMLTDVPQNEKVSDDMNISMAFKQIALKDPPRYTELIEAVEKAFEDISECISPEEFANILGDLSFLENKKNLTNLLCKLKTQFSCHMTKIFEEIIERENLSELFTKKSSLDKEEANKYLIDNDSMELIELEETLDKLNAQVAELEETNEILLNKRQLNDQKYNELSERITKLLNELQTGSQYTDYLEQKKMLRKEE